MLGQKVLLNQMPIAIKDSKIDISSEETTKELAKDLTHYLKGGEIVYLYGEMGVGKTTFVRYLINQFQKNKKLHITEVTSPTFNLLNEYDINDLVIKHYDLFRLKDESEIKNLDLFENNQKFVQESLTGFNDSFFYGLPIFLELKDYVHVQSSGLQLTKSPGQFWVYLGSILLVLGIFCMIYIQEVRLWILKKKNNKNVLLALATNRHRYEFDQFAKKVSQQIRKILN